MGLAVLDDVVLLHAGAGLDDDVGLDRLAGVRVGHADDHRLSDGGMGGDHLFHLGRVDVEAGDDDEILDPIDEEEEAVVVDHRDVARAEPAVLGEGPLAGLGIVPVAAEDVRPSHPDLAGVPDQRVLTVGVHQAHAQPWQRHPDAAIGCPLADARGDHR